MAQGKRLKVPIDQHVVLIVAALQHLLESVMVAFGMKNINHLSRIDANYFSRRKVKCMSEVLNLDVLN